MSFTIRSDTSTSTVRGSSHFGLPVGNPTELVVQPKGSLVYCPTDGFVYVSDGTNWDRVSGVNNAADTMVPITQSRVPRWTEDYPTGNGQYLTGPVLQDSALDIDDSGNALLHDVGDQRQSFPWKNGNLATTGSLVTNYTVGMSLDPEDPLSFTPILTQTAGPREEDYAPDVSSLAGRDAGEASTRKDNYQNGSVVIGHGALDDIIMDSIEPTSTRNVLAGVMAGQHLASSAEDNVVVGAHALRGDSRSLVVGSGNTVVGADAGAIVSDTHNVTASRNVVLGKSTKVTHDVDRAVLVGAGARCFHSGNTVVGTDADDGNLPNVIVLGDHAVAKSGNRVVLDSGITVSPVDVSNGTPHVVASITVQIGNDTYLIPLLRALPPSPVSAVLDVPERSPGLSDPKKSEQSVDVKEEKSAQEDEIPELESVETNSYITESSEGKI